MARIAEVKPRMMLPRSAAAHLQLVPFRIEKDPEPVPRLRASLPCEVSKAGERTDLPLIRVGSPRKTTREFYVLPRLPRASSRTRKAL